MAGGVEGPLEVIHDVDAQELCLIPHALRLRRVERLMSSFFFPVVLFRSSETFFRIKTVNDSINDPTVQSNRAGAAFTDVITSA